MRFSIGWRAVLSSSLGLACAGPIQAQDVFSGDVVIQGGLFVDDQTILDNPVCIGNTCSSGETFNTDTAIKLKFIENVIQVDDTSPDPLPNTDWNLRFNDNASGELERFAVEDATAGTTPFSILADAPENALVVESSTGDIGLGTMFPLRSLHFVRQYGAGIRFEMFGDPPVGIAAQTYEIVASNAGIRITDTRDTFTTPFLIKSRAPTNAFVIDKTGNIGMGTYTPVGPLELSTDDSFNFFRIAAEGAAVNKSVDIVFTQGPLGTGQLRYNIVEDTDSPQVPEMTLDAEGNMSLTGTLTTAGPSCAAGCDRVFDADYPLPSIADHASAMFSAGHLPSLGATQPYQPVNLSERQGKIINALEHAHIYIHELLQRSEADRAVIAQQKTVLEKQSLALAQLAARLEALETK